VPVLSEDVRARTAAVWHHRAVSERYAQARFDAILAGFEGSDVPESLRALAREAKDDEVRHETLCGSTAALFENSERILPTVRPFRTPTDADELLATTFSSCALLETANTALLTLTLSVVEEPAVHDAVHAILKDEVAHARLGWAHLAFEGNRRDCAFLADRLPAMLDRALSEEALLPHAPLDDEAAHARAGNLSWRPRLRSVRDVLSDVILPGLRLHRIPTAPAEAWIAAKLDPLGL